MKAKIGTVIVDGQKKEVVLKTINDVVEETMPLEMVMAQKIVVEYDGRMQTLKEIIDYASDEYMSRCEVIEVEPSDQTARNQKGAPT